MRSFVLAALIVSLGLIAYAAAPVGTTTRSDANRIQGKQVQMPYSSNNGQVLTYSGNKFVFRSISGGMVTPDATAVTYNNPTYPTVAQALDQLLYTAPAISGHMSRVTFTNTTTCKTPCVSSLASSNTIEVGNTVSHVYMAWTLNKTVTSQSYDNSIGAISAAFRTYSTNQTFTSSRTYTLTASDGTTPTTSGTTTYIYHKRYYGTSSETTLTDAQVIALSSEFGTTNHKGSVTSPISFSPSSQYIYYAYPASWGGATTDMYLNGLQMTDWQLTARNFVNSSGNTTSFNIWRSTNLLNGTYTWWMQ